MTETATQDPIVGPVEVYCTKCRAKRTAKDPYRIVMKNGRDAAKGTCPECGSTVFRVGRPE